MANTRISDDQVINILKEFTVYPNGNNNSIELGEKYRLNCRTIANWAVRAGIYKRGLAKRDWTKIKSFIGSDK